jgi:linoleoyl-CoA desaturase
VVDVTEFPEPDSLGNMKDDWAAHQLKTTTNFAQKSWFFSWFVGGLNFQVEHHLFPKISHIHYPKINEIVKNTCAEFGIPYQENDTFIIEEVVKEKGKKAIEVLHEIPFENIQSATIIISFK